MQKRLYKDTVRACYIANFFQAIGMVIPIVFAPLKQLYGLTYMQLGSLIFVNFVTQVISDIAFSKPVDKYGFRPFIILSSFLSAGGLCLFALTPLIFKGNEYAGFLIAIILFASASGLMELLLSPIIDAVPIEEKNKAKAMSSLHSLFAWGQIFVITISTLFIYIAGIRYWYGIVLFWSFAPLLNIFTFSKAPLRQKLHESQVMKIKELLFNSTFIMLVIAIISGGASEVTMSQWSSVFFERAVQLPKIVGDLFGMCTFAFMLGLGRSLYGIFGHKIEIGKIMIISSAAAIAGYVMVAVSSNSIIALVGCGMTGLCVSLLWPGTIVLASKKLPFAGASMFALLSAAGDIGASIGSSVTGFIADFSEKFFLQTTIQSLGLNAEQFGLKMALLTASIFPIGSLIINLKLQKKKREQEAMLAARKTL